jgi:hypothetical protein
MTVLNANPLGSFRLRKSISKPVGHAFGLILKANSPVSMEYMEKVVRMLGSMHSWRGTHSRFSPYSLRVLDSLIEANVAFVCVNQIHKSGVVAPYRGAVEFAAAKVSENFPEISVVPVLDRPLINASDLKVAFGSQL